MVLLVGKFVKKLKFGLAKIFEKTTFGSRTLAEFIRDENYDEVELVGICTDICVVSNALLIKPMRQK